jgi:hypothetical protein
MKMAAIAALAPSMPHGKANIASSLSEPDLGAMFDQTMSSTKDNKATWMSPTGHSVTSPIVWIDYTLEHSDPAGDFDKQLDSGSEDVPRIRVRLAYFFQYRIPFANWVMVRFWLAQQGLLTNWGQSDGSDSTLMVVKARSAGSDKLASHVAGDVKAATDEMVNRIQVNMVSGMYTLPIVTTWSMRMFSDPTSEAMSKGGNWKCQ